MPLACGLGGRKLAGRTEGLCGGGGRGAGPAFQEEESDHTALLLPRSPSPLRLLSRPAWQLLPPSGIYCSLFDLLHWSMILFERPGRPFLGLCKLRVCWGPDGDP